MQLERHWREIFVTISVVIKSYADEKQWLSIFLSAAEQLPWVSYQDRLLPVHKK